MSPTDQPTRQGRHHTPRQGLLPEAATESLERLGRYVLERPLARGGMGDVWCARREGPAGYEHDVALKRIHPALVDEDQNVRLFLREAQLGSRLRHPNTVAVIDFDIENGAPYLVMELVDGIDLRRLAGRGEQRGTPIPPPLAGYVMHQVLWALQAALELCDDEGRPTPLVHRDISPENILVGRYGDVRIVDFGLAKQLNAESLTRAGVVRGKFCYMSPEQLSDSGVDGRSDLYSAGITLYELLTGRRPYEAGNPLEAMERLQQPSPGVLELRPDVPASLADLVEHWRSPYAERRARDVREAREQLAGVLDGLLSGVPGVQLAEWTRRVTTDPPAAQVTVPRQALTRPCAKCGGVLQTRQTRDGVLADTCADCHGVWLDARELYRIIGGELTPDRDAAADAAAPAELDAVRGDCPSCGKPLSSHRVKGRSLSFHVEFCQVCHGLWLDEGELEQLPSASLAELVWRFRGLDL